MSAVTRLSASLPATRTRRTSWARVVNIGILIAASVLVLLPFLYVLSLAFTPESQAFGAVSVIPTHPTLQNFVAAVIDAHVGRALLNSALVACITVAANAVFAVLAGYAFAILPFPGSRPLFYTLVATSAVPASVTLIPLFLIAKNFPLVGGNDIAGHGGSGLIDTYAGLVLPYIVMPLNIYLSRQFFLTAPLELAEAARVDGSGELRIFTQVYLPLAKPLLAVVAIFSFTGAWDDFLWPLVVTNSPQIETVQLALARFLAAGNVQYGPVMACAVLATLPVLVVFLFNQRNFISGLADGGIKG